MCFGLLSSLSDALSILFLMGLSEMIQNKYYVFSDIKVDLSKEAKLLDLCLLHSNFLYRILQFIQFYLCNYIDFPQLY